MFDLDTEVRRWREHAEGKSSLSPREVDELEDHLRARVDLELELNGALTPVQAFAAASEDVGEPAALSKEFVKAGRPRWRPLLVAAWAMFAVSWFLPAVVEYIPIPPAPDGTLQQHVEVIPGWEAFVYALFGWAGPVGSVSALTNVLMLVTGLGVPQTSIESALGRPPHGRSSSSQCAVLAVLGDERRRHGPATRLRGVGGFLRPGGSRPLATCARMGLRPA